MNIQVDPSRLIEKSNEIKTLKIDLLNTMEQIELLVLYVGGSWQGDAERAFAEKILFVKKQFGNIATFFDDYAELLKSFAYTYEQQETDLSSKINLA
ncbi:MAG: WXG100 family type VII secretion target [Clostridia bacterium]|nr:WXG100 family type VII secretion target [Clostridia bacterium]